MAELVAVTQRVATVPEYGETRDCLDQAWTTWLESAGYTPFPVPNRIGSVERLLDTIDISGVILTGGNDLSFAEYSPSQELDDTAPERDATERRLLEVCGRREIPVMAFCRGLQVLHAHDGGTLRPLESTSIEHVASPHEVEFLLDSWTRLAGTSRLVVNSFHDFGFLVDDAVGDWEIAARSDDGVVEGMAHRSLPFVGVAWHPERDNPHAADFDRALVRETFGGSGPGVERFDSAVAT